MTPSPEHEPDPEDRRGLSRGRFARPAGGRRRSGHVPNGPMPLAIGPCLGARSTTAPWRSSARLLEIGANPNPEDHIGFPPLMAALSRSRSQPGGPARPDVLDIMKLLLEFGADPNQRGINDYTPLHMAVGERQNLAAVRLLLEAGADPELRRESTTSRRRARWRWRRVF